MADNKADIQESKEEQQLTAIASNRRNLYRQYYHPTHTNTADGVKRTDIFPSLDYASTQSLDHPCTGSKELLTAVWKNQLQEVKDRLNAGDDANSEYNGRYSALGIAAELGYIEIAKELIESGANVNHPIGDNKWTPLHLAAQRNELEMVKLLLSSGADNTATTLAGTTPLMLAINFYSTDENNCVEVLCSPETVNAVHIIELYDGYAEYTSPLKNAIVRRSIANIRTLLAHGADPHLRPRPDLKTVYEYTQGMGCPDLVLLMNPPLLAATLD
jgi:hypothetical protein